MHYTCTRNDEPNGAAPSTSDNAPGINVRPNFLNIADWTSDPYVCSPMPLQKYDLYSKGFPDERYVAPLLHRNDLQNYVFEAPKHFAMNASVSHDLADT